ncbi:MAG: hypothetical protein AAF843_17370 [Bacteroidota bacterium]
MSIKKAAIVLARMNSKRFPGKALHNIEGRCLLEWCVFNLKKQSNYDIVLATSSESSDEPLSKLAEELQINCFRGHLHDVYLRVIECIDYFQIKSFARINGDSPFPSSELINQAFDLLESENLDFVTNLAPRSFPYGVAVEVFDAQMFKVNYQNLSSDAHHEHITSYFYENLNSFKYKNISSGIENLEDIRLVVDEVSDINSIQKVIKSIDANKPISYEEITKILKEDND